MLHYTLRVRDLVHGTILFTEEERKLIDHPLFQRLRQIGQNDVAFYVYPSVRSSRLEHVLGTCRVAGMMAEHLVQSSKWPIYVRQLREQTEIATPAEFVALVRFYALLHDIGHLPLSHLFELAVIRWKFAYYQAIEEWTGTSGFKKLHEAIGAVIVQQLLQNGILPEPVQKALLRLMTEKLIPPDDPLSIVKSLVDSEIDADRIDSIQRDGLLAGGEYGHYDIRRLADSVFIEQVEDNWRIAYSEKALTSMEALLLDRYRAHIWIHYHHRVVAVKLLVIFLIARALETGLVTKDDFNPAHDESFALKDDIWLWHVLRTMSPDNSTTALVKRAVFARDKQHLLSLWKNRPVYHKLQESAKEKAGVTKIDFGSYHDYENYLSSHMSVRALMFKVPFEPTGRLAIPMYSESEHKLTGKNLLDVSLLVTSLDSIWENDAQEFILLIGNNASEKGESFKQQWIDLTAQWQHQ